MQDELEKMMAADVDASAGKVKDKLDYLRKHVKEKRDLDLRISDAEEALKLLKVERQKMEYETLPQLFMEAGVTFLGLPAEGNTPSATYELNPHYYANISAEWDPERREEGFAMLKKLHLDDLIKNKFVIALGRDQGKIAVALEKVLRKMKVPFSRDKAVAWNSLTAAVREIYEKGKELDDIQKRVLGATAGHVVKLKVERKKKDKA